MKKKLSLILVILIILLAAYLRLYRIGDYMTFLGDEGRDVLVAKHMLEGNFTLLGPRSSAGDFYMGPAYYYMIPPFLWLFNMDPVGPAVMVALFGIATVWLVYFVGKKWFNEATGLFAAALYAVSPVVINYSHSSWNPDVLPFFALLFIFLLYKAVDAKKPLKYFLGAGFLLGINLQLHYLSILLGVIAAIYIFWAYWYKKKKLQIIQIGKSYGEILIGFLVGFSPFLAFEVRHGFTNIKSIFGFIFGDTLHKSYETHATYLSIVSDALFRIFARLVFYFPSPDKYTSFDKLTLEVFAVCSIIVGITAIVYLFFTKNKQVVMLCTLWLFLSVLLLGLYKKPIYDYLFTFLFPLPFLIVGNFLSRLTQWSKNKKQNVFGITVGIILFLGIFGYSLSGMPFRYEPNRQKNQAKIISESVIEHAHGKPYNFALISGGNSDHAYRYFLEILGHPPVQIQNMMLDPKRKSVTGQLIIVCEDTSCKPLGHALFDVAAFGRAQIAEEWVVSVVKLYRLIPYVEPKK